MAAKKRAKKTTKKARSVVAKRSAKRASSPPLASGLGGSKAASVVRQGDKAAFVRNLPRSMAASEVVDRAREKSMIISKAYVHNIRSAANKAARALMAKEGKKTVKGGKKKLETQFRELVVTLGPARAKKLLSQVETSLAIAARK
jgi:hypothetical protein